MNESILIMRDNFHAFAQFISIEVFKFKDNSKFLKDFCEFYQSITVELESGKSTIATVSAPVQHGKTTKNLMWLAWMTGRTQGKIPLNYFCADDNLRRRASREYLKIVTSRAFELVFGDFFSKATSSDGIFTLMDSDIGFRLCGGGHTGFPSSISIIDDPYKARSDAFSEAKIKSVKEYFETDVFSRLTPAYAVIVLHSRWHTKDLIGTIDRDPNRWQAKSFVRPAILDDGTALMPEWRPIEWLEKQRATLGSQMFAALYEQKPVESVNSPFNIDRIPYDNIPDKTPVRYYITVDPANSKSASADYTCIFVFAVTPDAKFYLVDGLRDRLNINERSTALRNFCAKYNPGWVGYERYGMQVDIEYIQAERSRLNLPHLPIVELGGRMSKEDRILRLVGLFNNKILMLPITMIKRSITGDVYDLVAIIIDELLDFPVGEHDDAIDALSRIIDIWTAKPSYPEKTIKPNTGAELKKQLLRPKNTY